jgi:hypothetical protein
MEMWEEVVSIAETLKISNVDDELIWQIAALDYTLLSPCMLLLTLVVSHQYLLHLYEV